MAKEKPGVKPKYKDGIKTTTLKKLIPAKRKKECIDAIERIVEKEKADI